MGRRNLPAIVPAVRATAAPTGIVGLFTGFDDHMEKREPGWKARQAAAKAERERQRQIRRAALIEHYGSEEAALAPCPREALFAEALAPWRTLCDPPWQRWTLELDGYDLLSPLPEHLTRAVREAYPMPATFVEALAEHRYWETRRAELADLLGPEGHFRNDDLDLVAQLRADMVRHLAEHELPTTTLVELHQRFQLLRDSEIDEPKIEAALFRDLGTMVQQGAAS